MLNEFLKVAYTAELAKQGQAELTSLLSGLPENELRALASGTPVETLYGHLKLAYPEESGSVFLERFRGTPLFEQALGLEQEELQADILDQQRREEQRAAGDPWELRSKIQLKKRMLELELAKMQGAPPAMPEAPDMPAQGAGAPGPVPAEGAQDAAQGLGGGVAKVAFADNFGRMLARQDMQKAAHVQALTSYGTQAGTMMAKTALGGVPAADALKNFGGWAMKNRAAAGALVGGAAGAVGGAVAGGPGNRLSGAVKGGLGGAAVGGLAGGMSQHLTNSAAAKGVIDESLSDLKNLQHQSVTGVPAAPVGRAPAPPAGGVAAPHPAPAAPAPRPAVLTPEQVREAKENQKNLVDVHNMLVDPEHAPSPTKSRFSAPLQEPATPASFGHTPGSAAPIDLEYGMSHRTPVFDPAANEAMLYQPAQRNWRGQLINQGDPSLGKIVTGSARLIKQAMAEHAALRAQMEKKALGSVDVTKGLQRFGAWAMKNPGTAGALGGAAVGAAGGAASAESGHGFSGALKGGLAGAALGGAAGGIGGRMYAGQTFRKAVGNTAQSGVNMVRRGVSGEPLFKGMPKAQAPKLPAHSAETLIPEPQIQVRELPSPSAGKLLPAATS